MAKYRLQVIMSEELKEKLEKYCNLTGVSMSGLCNVFIANGLMGYEKAMEMMDGYSDKIAKK